MITETPDHGDASATETTAADPDLADAGRSAVPGAAPGKTLPPEAIRALEEAEARRQAATRQDLPTEIDGRDGPEPTRYGDWEKKGLAVDF
jgi:hypothetical protein